MASATGGDPERLLAAIDIGTNSVHMVIARALVGGGFELATREKEMVRLGEGAGGDMRELSPEAIERGIAALVRAARLIEVHGAEVKAVATSAVREAQNRQEFVERAFREAGIRVEVISGVEEARLIHLGVLQALPLFDQKLLLVDIGGGSTELLVGRAGTVRDARSVKAGAVRLTDRFFPNGKVSAEAAGACRQHLRSFLAPAARDIRLHGHEVAVGSSGTVTAVAEMIEKHHGREPTRWLNNVSFDRTELDAVTEQLLDRETTDDRRGLPGLDPKRADIMPAGAILLQELFRLLKIERMTVSAYALREGVLLDMLQPVEGGTLHHLNDIRSESIGRLMETFEQDRGHVSRSTDLALTLFDELASLHGLDGWSRDLLEGAGSLHNIGLFISHAAHHKHSYYVIRHSDRLLGFTEREVELMAVVARYHRKAMPTTAHTEFEALSPDDRERVRVLAGLLRISIALDRSHEGVVASVRVKIRKSKIRITVDPADGADVELELYAANQRSRLLADVLGKEVTVVVG